MSGEAFNYRIPASPAPPGTEVTGLRQRSPSRAEHDDDPIVSRPQPTSVTQHGVSNPVRREHDDGFLGSSSP